MLTVITAIYLSTILPLKHMIRSNESKSSMKLNWTVSFHLTDELEEEHKL